MCMCFYKYSGEDYNCVHNIIYLIKLVYRFLCKRYFVMLFIFILIFMILIFHKNFVQFLLIKNNFNVSIFIKKYVLCSFEEILNKKFYNDLTHINILKKCLNINNSIKELTTYNYIVFQNDILDKILMKNSKEIDSFEIDSLTQQYPVLKNLRIGQTLSWSVMTNGKLKSLIWGCSSQEMRVYNRVDIGFTENIIRIINQSKDKFFNRILFIGMLNGTFIDSARSLGIEEKCVTDIINALRYQLNFRKLRQGDKFAILISVIVNNDYSIETKFIGFRLCTSGKDYYAFRANNGKFYDHKAVKLGNGFIRFPVLQPFRISSSFNLHRLNPITRKISPHAGVDFAVPIDTPVLSIGNGEVIVSAYSKVAGNYIVIRHNYWCITRYMHLNKLLVKSGQRVRCGDNIALSGNTGRSTGPHLHFEIWMNCRPVDPLNVNLLNIKKLSGNDRIVYLGQVKKVLPQLCFD